MSFYFFYLLQNFRGHCGNYMSSVYQPVDMFILNLETISPGNPFYVFSCHVCHGLLSLSNLIFSCPKGFFSETEAVFPSESASICPGSWHKRHVVRLSLLLPLYLLFSCPSSPVTFPTVFPGVSKLACFMVFACWPMRDQNLAG